MEEARPVPAGWFGWLVERWMMAVLPTGSIWVASILPPRDQPTDRGHRQSLNGVLTGARLGPAAVKKSLHSNTFGHSLRPSGRQSVTVRVCSWLLFSQRDRYSELKSSSTSVLQRRSGPERHIPRPIDRPQDPVPQPMDPSTWAWASMVISTVKKGFSPRVQASRFRSRRIPG